MRYHPIPPKVLGGLSATPSKRTLLTDEEARALLADIALGTVWQGSALHWCLNLTAASTGDRMGALQALRLCDVHADHLDISRIWRRQHGFGPPRANSARVIPIPSRIAHVLSWLMVTHPASVDTESILFCSFDDPYIRIDHGTIMLRLYAALHAVGISESERRNRRLSFHAWRAWANTRVRVLGVPDAKVRHVLGHTTPQMTERYTAFRPSDFADVVPAMEALT